MFLLIEVSDSQPAIQPALIVAACALLFTVASFWWINARQGRLRSYEPHSFASAVSGERVHIRLPLALHNTGAKPIVVQNLRLRFLDEPALAIGLPWQITRTQLRPIPEDYEDMPAVFAVSGRSVVQKYVEFVETVPGFALDQREYAVTVEAKLGHRKNWVPLVKFQLRAQNIKNQALYLAHSNDPGWNG